MKQVICLIIILVSFIGCKNKETKKEIVLENTETSIIGHWSPDNLQGNHLEQLNYMSYLGFEFINDSICNYKDGFVDYNAYMDDPRSREDKFLKNLGTKTKYSLTEDSLKIFNLSENRWDAYKLKSLKGDSLIIENKGVSNIFLKRHFNLDTIPDFDAVAVASTPCFGMCPIFEIIVTKEGKVSYHGEEYLKNEGHYTSHISKSEFKNIMTRFKQANYMNLQKEYFTMVTDCATVYITFIKNGKIVQSISDYAASSPPEFVYAYKSLFNLEQKMKVVPREVPNYLYDDYAYYMSLTGKKYAHLTTSEAFYIINSLVEGKETNKTFNEEYKIIFSNKLSGDIKTDGRYYKIYLKDGTTKTIDVGINLLNGSNFCEPE